MIFCVYEQNSFWHRSNQVHWPFQTTLKFNSTTSNTVLDSIMFRCLKRKNFSTKSTLMRRLLQLILFTGSAIFPGTRVTLNSLLLMQITVVSHTRVTPLIPQPIYTQVAFYICCNFVVCREQMSGCVQCSVVDTVRQQVTSLTTLGSLVTGIVYESERLWLTSSRIMPVHVK